MPRKSVSTLGSVMIMRISVRLSGDASNGVETHKSAFVCSHTVYFPNQWTLRKS